MENISVWRISAYGEYQHRRTLTSGKFKHIEKISAYGEYRDSGI
jgi:hypothetical protein